MSIIERDVTVPSELRERVRQQERLREPALFSTSSEIDVEPLYTPAFLASAIF